MLKMHKGVIIKIRSSKTFKGLAVCLILNIFAEIAQPSISLALTDGPSQPEVRSFEPIGTTQMVDLFSGDFNYNIPLFNLPGPNGGYPVNIAYHAGISMDDEASWVGLGWNINPGSLMRNMRGLPDEFLSTGGSEEADADHDYLEIKSDIKQSWTLGMSLGLGAGLEILGADQPLGSLNFSLYYNNYKGFGTGASTDIGKKDGNFKMGISLDSENGLGLSASLNHDNESKQMISNYKLGVNFNGGLSFDHSLSRDKYVKHSVFLIPTKKGFIKIAADWTSGKNTGAGTYSGTYSFAANQFSPAVGRRMNNYNLSASIAFDVEGGVIAGELSTIGMFYQTQDINDKDKNGRRIPVVGYDNFGKQASHHYTRDFMRQNDGQLTKSSIMLSNSYYTNDSYLSTGQGLLGYFKPKRNDIGKVFDPYVYNTSAGLSLGFDAGAGGLIKLGGNFGINFGWDTQSSWTDKNDLDADFLEPILDGIDENLFYQAHGEQTILNSDLAYMNGLGLASIKLTPKGSDGASGGKRTISSLSATFQNDGHNNSVRNVRNTLIHTLPNKKVANLGEFNIKHYDASSGSLGINELSVNPTVQLNRNTRGTVSIEDHKAGFKVLNEEGSYYVYALPAYNKKEVENLFSVAEPSNPGSVSDVGITMNSNNDEVKYKFTGSKSHKFINKTTKSPFAHSFLLTSVQGADYVDIKNDGPTNDDLGYWVKFDYQQVATNYKWRSPYHSTNAKYHRNASYTSSDDKASYQYGEKEIWNMARIETKSHIAIFITSPRNDNREADGEFPGSSGAGNKHGVKLDSIKIYDKNDFTSTSKPIQSISFEYHDYGDDLCQGTQNSNNNHGKLTLKSITFNSMGSTRGDLSKYEFGYAGQQGMGGINPIYKPYSFDGWGVYRVLSSDVDMYEHFPYVNQFHQSLNPELDNLYSAGYTAQQIQDDFASAWCLKQIKLPSGGTINIDYESDDYAHVQHKIATQMFGITEVNSESAGNDELYSNGNNNFYDQGTAIDERRRRIYFKLEVPIPINTTNLEQKIYNDYVKPLTTDEAGERNLYFKSRMRLTKSPDVYDYVSGYLPLENSVFGFGSEPNYNVDINAIQTVGAISYYTHGFVTLQASKKKNGGYFDKYHPMALAAWTYLQTNAQDLLNNPNSFDSESESNSDPIGQIADIINVIPMLMTSFGGIRSYCKSKDMARFIDLSKSCIRLASPDRKKFGGGHRIKQISLSDNWDSDTQNSESNRSYGLTYDYTTKDEFGNVISSGVATYEPQAIGDENALKYPIHFYGKTSIFTNNNLFVEYPINQDLFPGASVGYSKITTKSINTNVQLKNLASRGRTSGITVNEFYTARDFPTFVSWSTLSESNDTKDVFNVPIPLPFIGIIKRTYFHGTQAFLIETNDMHGKMKSIKTFEVNINSNAYMINPNPITESVVEYQCKPMVYQGEKVLKLENEVSVIPNDNSHAISNTKRLMGVEVDLFTDQRENKAFSQTLGLDINVDVPMIPAFLPTVWPSFNNVKSMTRTYTTNKIVHRTGIVKKTKSRDLQSTNESEVLAYDERSGVPMLSKVKNEFGDDFYSYNIPAYYNYNRMGHAYQNIGFNFEVVVPAFNSTAWQESQNQSFIEVPASGLENYLIRGDELLMTSETNSAPNEKRKAYFIGWGYDSGQTVAKLHIINAVNQSSAQVYRFEVIRSGRRNHYSSMSATYVTKGKLSSLLNTVQHTLKTNVSTPVINEGVLSASATVYKDDWSTTSKEIGSSLAVKNAFLEGNSGIWRPYKSYTYIGKRKGNATLTNNTDVNGNPKLYEDGLFEDPIPMFSYEIGNMENYVSNWEWVNEITRYSGDSYELENMNRLNINSSALYGYDNSLTIGVGGNSDIHEIGVTDFETIGNMSFSRQLVQTNLNFDNSHSLGELFITKKYNIISAIPFSLVGTTANMNVLTDLPYSYYEDLVQEGSPGNIPMDLVCGLELISTKTSIGVSNEGYYFNGFLRGEITNVGGFANFKLKAFLENQSDTKHVLKLGTDHYGKITFLFKRNYNQSPTVEYVANKAHTGKKSMKVSSDVVFDQPKIVFKPNKTYVASLWISRNNTKVSNFNPENVIKLGTVTGTTFSEITPSKITTGKIIEGWQKIDLEFSLNSNLSIFAIKFLSGGENLYVDDIRISPKTGGMTTYVYDVKNYRLSASLNVDNYATLFFYDEEGNLTLKKQETEKGIFTITESRGHVSEN